MISTNNIQKCYEVLLKVIKNIFCISEHDENCSKCSLCHLIDIQNLPSLKVIEPDGNFIKKEQILDLKYFFSKESQYTKENIYIIKNAEKMNKESANTMLKFLEEPEGSVIGFFLTSKLDNVLLTIQSRCQHLEVNFANNPNEELGISEEDYNKYVTIIKEYLQKIEVEKTDLILYNKEYLSAFSKDEIKIIFQIILNIYKEVLNKKILKDEENIELGYLKSKSMENLKQKVNLLINLLQEINYNVNEGLLLDKFIIKMEEINNEVL